jgi:hypothetical protein
MKTNIESLCLQIIHNLEHNSRLVAKAAEIEDLGATAEMVSLLRLFKIARNSALALQANLTDEQKSFWI